MTAERNAGEGSSSGTDGDIKVKDAQSTISKAKAKGIGPEKYLAEAEAEHNLWKTAIGGIYAFVLRLLYFRTRSLTVSLGLQRLRGCFASVKHT
jgi:hypothetical protein